MVSAGLGPACGRVSVAAAATEWEEVEGER